MSKKVNKLLKDFQKTQNEILSLKKNLTDEEIEFCEFYIQKTSSPYGGLTKTTKTNNKTINFSNDILSNANVSKYIYLRQKQIKDTFLNENAVLIWIYSTFLKCVAEEQVIDKHGHPTGEYKLDSKGAIDSLKLLSNYFKMTTDNQNNVTVNQIPNIDITKKDLDKFLKDFNEQY